MISLLLGLQLGNTKHMSFLCLWDSRDDNNHYTETIRPPREELAIVRNNVKHVPLLILKSVLFITAYKTRTNEKFCQSNEPLWKRFSVLVEKICQ